MLQNFCSRCPFASSTAVEEVSKSWFGVVGERKMASEASSGTLSGERECAEFVLGHDGRSLVCPVGSVESG